MASSTSSPSGADSPGDDGSMRPVGTGGSGAAAAGSRSLPVALAQTVYLLLGILAVSALAGMLMAAFLLPAVSATSAVAEDGVELFESYPTELEVEPLNEASRIEAADGTLLATFYSQNRIMVPLEEISPNMQHAVIAVEDRRFYEHGGVDARGMARAFASNAAGGSTQGGSTLTQQYVKNALLMDAVQRNDDEARVAATEQTYGRKLREAKLAISLEKTWTKDEILNAYLNVAQFGPSQYGVQTGAKHYFNKDAADLNPGEAALLAGITNGPNQYDPVDHPEAGETRRNEVLADMLGQGYITQEEYDEYSEQPVEDMLDIQTVQAGCVTAEGSGFFCDYVTRSLLNDPDFGDTYEDRSKLLYGGGLTIKTTLDPEKQAAAEEILERRVPATSQSGFGHSIVTVEPGTGEILVMAENRTYNPYEDVDPGETAINYNVPQALGGGSGFPVGSTFKPFVLQEWLENDRSIYDTVATARQTMTTFPAQCLPRGRWYESGGYNPDNAVSVELSAMETVLNATKFSVNTAYANMARQLDLCNIAEGAREIGVVPATYNPYDQSTWRTRSRTSTAPSWRRRRWSSVSCGSPPWTWPRPTPPTRRRAPTASRRPSPRSPTATARTWAWAAPSASRRWTRRPPTPWPGCCSRTSRTPAPPARAWSSRATRPAARPVPPVRSSTPGTSASPARCPPPSGSATPTRTSAPAASPSTGRP